MERNNCSVTAAVAGHFWCTAVYVTNRIWLLKLLKLRREAEQCEHPGNTFSSNSNNLKKDIQIYKCKKRLRVLEFLANTMYFLSWHRYDSKKYYMYVWVYIYIYIYIYIRVWVDSLKWRNKYTWFKYTDPPPPKKKRDSKYYFISLSVPTFLCFYNYTNLVH